MTADEVDEGIFFVVSGDDSDCHLLLRETEACVLRCADDESWADDETRTYWKTPEGLKCETAHFKSDGEAVDIFTTRKAAEEAISEDQKGHDERFCQNGRVAIEDRAKFWASLPAEEAYARMLKRAERNYRIVSMTKRDWKSLEELAHFLLEREPSQWKDWGETPEEWFKHTIAHFLHYKDWDEDVWDFCEVARLDVASHQFVVDYTR